MLPLHNTNADPSIDFLRMALADEIATTLSRARGVAVRPFSTTSPYDATGLDVRKAGRAAGADTLVTGRIGKALDQLSITLEVIDVADNALLWRDTIEAPAQSLLATHGTTRARGARRARTSRGRPRDGRATGAEEHGGL